MVMSTLGPELYKIVKIGMEGSFKFTDLKKLDMKLRENVIMKAFFPLMYWHLYQSKKEIDTLPVAFTMEKAREIKEVINIPWTTLEM